METTAKIPPILYHYTSSCVLLSIVQKSSIWLSINEHLNDYNEGVLFMNALRKYLKKEEKFNAIDSRLSAFDCYMICMSVHRDMLSQWRGYGANGAGVSIGFNSNVLKKVIAGHHVALLKDISYIDDLSQIIGANANLFAAITQSSGEPSSGFLQSVTKEKWRLKNKAFSEEAEYRLLLTPDPGQDEIFLNELTAKRCYRATDFDVREYFELPFEKHREDFISEVVIGPRNESNIKSIERLLKRYGYTGAAVFKSAASYR